MREALSINNINLAEQAIIQLADQLTYMHEENFLYRDIKSDNIFIILKNSLHVVLSDLSFVIATSNLKIKYNLNKYYISKIIKDTQ